MNALYDKNFQVEWDVLNLVSMKDDSRNLVYLREYLSAKGIRNQVYGISKSPYITLPETMEAYMQSLSRKTRWKFRDYSKKLAQSGAVAMSVFEQPEDMGAGFDRFLSIHEKRWEDRENNGSFSQGRNKFLSFHRRIIKQFAARQWVQLMFLAVNGTPVAVQYNFVYANKIYCHSVGFDPQWREKNVGSVLQYMVLENAMSRKLVEFDFLRGTEEYKFYWTKSVRKSVDMAVWRSNTMCAVCGVEKALRRGVRSLLPEAMMKRLYARFFSRREDQQ
jgi:CelD/BcsL family acetyltransferase involved in cellulose biosynthesis